MSRFIKQLCAKLSNTVSRFTIRKYEHVKYFTYVKGKFILYVDLNIAFKIDNSCLLCIFYMYKKACLYERLAHSLHYFALSILGVYGNS